jgi:hypothetical protein
MENIYEIIEISEDAYKRNTVYRPWPDEKAGKAEDPAEVIAAEKPRTVSA